MTPTLTKDKSVFRIVAVSYVWQQRNIGPSGSSGTHSRQTKARLPTQHDRLGRTPSLAKEFRGSNVPRQSRLTYRRRCTTGRSRVVSLLPLQPQNSSIVA